MSKPHMHIPHQVYVDILADVLEGLPERLRRDNRDRFGTPMCPTQVGCDPYLTGITIRHDPAQGAGWKVSYELNDDVNGEYTEHETGYVQFQDRMGYVLMEMMRHEIQRRIHLAHDGQEGEQWAARYARLQSQFINRPATEDES